MKKIFLVVTLALTVSMRTVQPLEAQTLPNVIIREVQTSGGTGHTNDDFIELHNTSDKAVDVTGWQLRKKTKNDVSETGSSIRSFATDADTIPVIPAKGTLLWANSAGAFKTLTDTRFTSASSLTDDNSIALFDTNDTLIDSVTWGSGHLRPFAPSALYPNNPPANTSIERDLSIDTFLSQLHPSPENTALFEAKPTPPPPPPPPIEDPTENPTPPPTENPQDTSPTVRINEILPHPSDIEEYIELFNFGTEDIDLRNWSLHDASKTGQYVFNAGTVIRAGGYFTLSRSAFSFALNDTDETLTLFDPQKVAIDTVRYEKSDKDLSYGFSSSGFRWSDILTPGEPNRFKDTPTSKVSAPKQAYKNVPVTFKAKGSDENTEYLWDFGDGRKSRLKEAKHTYTKTGKYAVTLKVSNGIEETLQAFSVKVGKQPRTKISLVAIDPDPIGSDAGKESIVIRNDTGKKADLSGWSIATGTDPDKLANHPLNRPILIKPGKEIALTHDDTAFTLPNTKGFVEIRRPDKKPSNRIAYTKTDDIREGSLYQKEDDGSWVWISNEKDSSITDTDDPSSTKEELSDRTDPDSDPSPIGDVQSISTTNDILNAIENLPADELSLLGDHIRERLDLLQNMTAIPAESPASEDAPINTPGEPIETVDSQEKPSQNAVDTNEGIEKLSTIPEKKTLLSWIRKDPIASKNIPVNTSFLAREYKEYNESDIDTKNRSFFQSVNRAIGNTLHQRR